MGTPEKEADVGSLQLGAMAQNTVYELIKMSIICCMAGDCRGWPGLAGVGRGGPGLAGDGRGGPGLTGEGRGLPGLAGVGRGGPGRAGEGRGGPGRAGEGRGGQDCWEGYKGGKLQRQAPVQLMRRCLALELSIERTLSAWITEGRPCVATSFRNGRLSDIPSQGNGFQGKRNILRTFGG
jgi:hypothetical protein